MKKIIALLLALVMAFALVSCSTGGNGGSGDKDPCDTCVDKDANGTCDVCGNKVEGGKGPDLNKPLEVADFAKAMKEMNSSRVVISITETSELGSLSATYTVAFGNGDAATIAYVREVWNTNADIFDTDASEKITERGEIQYANGSYSGAISGAAENVARIALNLSADKLANVQINGTAAKGAQLIAAVPQASSADVLGVSLPSDAALSVTMKAGAQSITAFTLSYVDGNNQVTFAAQYQ